uniref:Uncharacterized protein n=1 Tax=Athene cunicularia TaxID=194338 RepID=A0A663LUQ4_ATHCN
MGDPARRTYEWRPCTPPSTWADVVLFSNFSSPEYIMALRGKDTRHKPARGQETQCSCPCTRLGPPWWQPGESPSSLAQEITENSVSAGLQPQNPQDLCTEPPPVPPSGTENVWKPFPGDSLQRAQPGHCAADLWRPRARGPSRCAQPSGSLHLQSRGRQTSWRIQTPCTPPWPGGGRTPALQAGKRAGTGSAPRSTTSPSPAGPFRLPAHTCSSIWERTNPWMLLP